MIKVGDKVVLKSGGPVMEVLSIRLYRKFECAWDSDARRVIAEFNPTSVEKVELHTKRGRAAASSSPS